MRDKRKRWLSAFLCFVILFFLPCRVSAKDAGVSFIADENSKIKPIPKVYEVYGTIKNLGDYGFMKHPEDIFLDANGSIFVADTGNNRVLKLDREGKVLASFTEGNEMNFNNPKGVYVHKDGTIWIADTNNLRIVKLNADGSFIGELVKPDSELLEESFMFAPEKIFVSNTGYIYVLKGSNLMLMDANNDFRGYVGSTKVNFSFKRFLVRTFGSKSQIERTMRQEPTSYVNFMIANDGMIYGLLADASQSQIRRLNTVGNNTYPEDSYGITLSRDAKTSTSPMFVDIAVQDNGILTTIDRNSGLIYQYDQEGNLLAAFGGIGDTKGTFQVFSSIAVDAEGYLYALDYSTNTITIFKPTNFISQVHNAVSLYNDGNYNESKNYWQEVLKIDSSYSLAHQGLGKIFYKELNFEESLNEYHLANDKEGYSEAFSEYRHELFRQYFLWIAIAAFGLVYGFYRLVIYSKRKADSYAYKIEMGGDL